MRLLAIACDAAAREATEHNDEDAARIAARDYDLIQRVGESGLHLPQELAERVRQFGASLQERFTAPVTDIAEDD